MSADNGIYILKTKDDQYRIIHGINIGKIFDENGRFNELELALAFGLCRFTKNRDKAIILADKMNEEIHTEYGIKEFRIQLTWKHILGRAKIIAENKYKDGKIEDEYLVEKFSRILEM